MNYVFYLSYCIWIKPTCVRTDKSMRVVCLKGDMTISYATGEQNKLNMEEKDGRRDSKTVRRDTMRHCYILSLFGAFNSLSCGITATISFSSAFFPFLIITTVSLTLLDGNLLNIDHRLVFLRSSLISFPSASASVDQDPAATWWANGAPESRFSINRRFGLRTELSRRGAEGVRL